MRAPTLSSGVLLLLVPCWLYGGATEAPSEGKPDVDVEVVIVGASGRGTKPVFGAGIPKAFRKKLEGGHLAYGKYDLVGIQRKPAAFGKEVSFTLPNREKLAVTPSSNPRVTHPLRMATQVLDSNNRVIQKIQVLISYDKPFLIHRPTGASAVIMGVAGRKPSAKP